MPTYDLTGDNSIRIVRLVSELQSLQREVGANAQQQKSWRTFCLMLCVFGICIAVAVWCNLHWHMVRP